MSQIDSNDEQLATTFDERHDKMVVEKIHFYELFVTVN